MSEPRKHPPEKAQPDGGYEEGHGYGPSHGGPTGPGDAPSPAKKEPLAPPPPAEDEDDDE